jgi:hypothetical protein
MAVDHAEFGVVAARVFAGEQQRGCGSARGGAEEVEDVDLVGGDVDAGGAGRGPELEGGEELVELFANGHLGFEI